MPGVIGELLLQLAGALLCSLVLPDGQGLLVDSDDLRDFYHSFAVSPARASRNAFNVVFPPRRSRTSRPTALNWRASTSSPA